MATAFMLLARLVSQGVSRNPSRLVMTSATAATSAAIADRAELQEGDDARCRQSTTTGPKYGIELKTPGGDGPDARLLQADPAERDPAGDAHQRSS